MYIPTMLPGPKHYMRKGKCLCKSHGMLYTVVQDLRHVTCQECLENYAWYVNQHFYSEVTESWWNRKLRQWTQFGEGDNGYLDWILVGVFTCGLGIPVMLGLKHLAVNILEEGS